jgi:allantoin racemase
MRNSMADDAHDRTSALRSQLRDSSVARVLLINPNSTTSITRRLADTARSTAPFGARIDAVTVADGPAYVETDADEAQAEAAVVDFVRGLEGGAVDGTFGPSACAGIIEGELATHPAAYDAYVIGCFSDPGLEVTRSITAKPVVGFGQATLLMAHALGEPFTVLCNVEDDVPAIDRLASAYGLGRNLVAIRPIGFTIAEFDRGDAVALESLTRTARATIEADGARVLCLGCAVFSNARLALTAELGVTVFDGLSAGLELATFFVGLGARRDARVPKDSVRRQGEQ